MVQAGKQAAIAGINVFNDVMEGKNVTDALLDRYWFVIFINFNARSTEVCVKFTVSSISNFRGIEALAKVDGAVPEYGKGFLVKVKQFKEGEPIEKLAADM